MDAGSDKLMQELRDVVAAAEELLGAGGSAERVEEIRGRTEEALRAARARLEGIELRLEDQVRRHPFAALGIAAVAGLVLGVLLARK
jgi:ElaB/YqjD/DUF883 family membrane-anchored ribosome-binding protein